MFGTLRISSRFTPGIGVKGEPDSAALTAKRVMGGQINLADEGVRRFDRGDPGEPELRDQAVLIVARVIQSKG
jgi:hypothetical protein